MSLQPDDARRLVDAMARARELTGIDEDALAPSIELQTRVFAAAREIGVIAEVLRAVDDDGRVVWKARVATARGTAERTVDDHCSWEDAFCDLGLLDPDA